MKAIPKTPKARGSFRPTSEHVAEILRVFDRVYADAQCSLDYTNPIELLVATILSAQCTDVRVNIVTKDLFRKYRRPEDFARARPGTLEKDIRSTGFFNNKAKSIRGACARILEAYGGKVPGTMDELLTLPGVARKTANVVLGTAFDRADGVVVDTHVHRLTQRLGLTRQKTPEKIEQDLMAMIPRDHWISLAHQLILHGRRVCSARAPDCDHCPLNHVCPRIGLGKQATVGKSKSRTGRFGRTRRGYVIKSKEVPS